jgi:hypothetical protein
VDKLAIALAGVVVGALVSEGLRFWHDYVQTNRRVRGSLRLIRHELALILSAFDGELDGDEIRRWIGNRTIGTTQWDANEAVLAEALSQDDWLALSKVYLGIRMLLATYDGMPAEEMVEIAILIRDDARAAGAVVWSKD